MLQELEILIDHNVRDYVQQLLLSYRPDDSGETYLLYLPLQNLLQHRTHIDKDKVKQLIQYLTVYIERLESPKQDFEAQRGISVPVETNPSRE